MRRLKKGEENKDLFCGYLVQVSPNKNQANGKRSRNKCSKSLEPRIYLF